MPPRILLRPHPEERAISAFTRVHSPSKTGVNALMDALWRASRRMGAAGHPKNSRREFLGTPLMLRDAHHHDEVPALALRDALLRNAPQGEGGAKFDEGAVVCFLGRAETVAAARSRHTHCSKAMIYSITPSARVSSL